MPSAPIPNVGVPWKSWDCAIGAIGIPRSGKTYLLRQRVAEIRARTTCYAIAHDPNGDWQGMRASSRDELLGHLARHPGSLHVLACDDGLELIAAAELIASQSRRAAGVDADRGVGHGRYMVPVLVVIDEAADVGGMSPHHLAPQFRRAYLRRRHLGLGFLWGSQRVSLVHPVLYDSSTELNIFRCNDEQAIERMRRAGVPREITDAAPTLAQGEHRTWRPWGTA